jgi:two-component system LytT family sensor kinase
VHKSPTKTSPPWPWITLIWLGVGLIDASQTVFPMRAEGMHHNWVRLFAILVIDWLPWALATPVVMRVGRRYPLFQQPLAKALAVHSGFVAIISLLTAGWSALLEVSLDPWAVSPIASSYTSLWLTRFSYGLLTSLIVYGFIQAIVFAMDSAERAAKQQTEASQIGEQLAKAQLDGLRHQMDPHFMFNTLNAIAGLVRDQKNDAAVSMIVGLSDLLRRSARDTDRPQVSLGEEIEYLQRYLNIQKARFCERLVVILDIPTDLCRTLVPNLLLQPLVENAIKHGIAKRVDGGKIVVTGRRTNNRLCVRVFNDGPRLSDNWQAAPNGIGIANLRTRLQILYGNHFELNVCSPESGGVEVAVSLPFDASS